MQRLLTVALAALVSLAVPAPAQSDAPSPPLWGSLDHGPFPVGFRSSWTLDRGRTYARPEAGLPRERKFARPVLVNVWYPAARVQREPMPRGDYLDIPADGETLDSLSQELAAYAKDIVAAEIAGAPLSELDGAARRRLDALLATPTAAIRAPAPAPGPFPLVVYHAGYGSSFEDNAVLCEYLASHGYIVVGSAFLAGDGGSLNIDAYDDSARDIEHLVRVACAAWPADWQRIALVGHSGGAHAAFRFIARENDTSPVDALVSLDTTQDYHSLADRRWDDMVPLLLEHADAIDIPLLFAARQHATFRMADRLHAAPRTYLTFRDLQHNSFISQGVLAAEFAESPEAPHVRAGYTELCHAVRLFLDAHLKGSATARAELRGRWAGAEPGLAPVAAEHVPPGEGPPTPSPHTDRPPTPREAAAMLDGGDTGALARALQAFRDDPRARPLFEVEFAIAAMFQLVHEGREADARWLLDCYPDQRAEVLRLLRALADYYARVGADQAAARFALVAAVLDEAEERP